MGSKAKTETVPCPFCGKRMVVITLHNCFQYVCACGASAPPATTKEEAREAARPFVKK